MSINNPRLRLICVCVLLCTLMSHKSWNMKGHLQSDSILVCVDVCFCELSSLALTQLHVTRASERLQWQTVMSSVRGHKHFGMPTHTCSQSEERSLWWRAMNGLILSVMWEHSVCVCFSGAGKHFSLEMGTNTHMHTPRADCMV